MSLIRESMPAASLAVAVTLVLAMGGCAKKNQDAATAPAQASTEVAAPTATASAATSAAPASPENDARAAAIQAALAEDAIVSDARGQWAVTATASSTYASDKAPESKTSYAPLSATGAPNVEHYGDNGYAWTAGTADKGIEWLEVGFAKPVQATQLRIRQSMGAGAIVKVDFIDEAGEKHAMWQGVDDQKYTPDQISWFDRTFEKTAYKVTGARITLATNAVTGWNEIDAVQLLGD